ncbi:TPA: hypothetical protein ACHJU3_001171 [Escherichia coli]
MKQEFLTVATQSADVRPEAELNRAERIKAALKAIKGELYNMTEEDLLELQQAVNTAIQKRNQVAADNKIAEAGLNTNSHQQANIPDFNDYF